jgi:ribosomal protein S18 acetylase RimI-like enzyme
VTIRAATLDDLDALVEGNLAMARETEALALERAVLERGVRAVLAGERAGSYRVLEQGRRVAAQLMITYEWSDWRAADLWWVQSVYVWPEHRRQGLYRRLYAHVREEARAAGAAGLRLYVEVENLAAQRTYAALGMNGARYTMFEDLFGDH